MPTNHTQTFIAFAECMQTSFLSKSAVNFL